MSPRQPASQRLVILFSVIIGLLAAGGLSAIAQQFSVDWYTVDGGGGSSSGGQYRVTGTIGQPDAGQLSGGSYVLDGGFWKGAIAIFTPGSPRVSLLILGGNVVASWPDSPATFTLEAQSPLVTGNWTAVPQTPVTNAGVVSVTVPLTASNQFFRLRH